MAPFPTSQMFQQNPYTNTNPNTHHMSGFYHNQMPPVPSVPHNQQVFNYHQSTQMYKKDYQYLPVQSNQSIQSNPALMELNKEKYLVQVQQPNNFEPGVTATCSYCFMPMKSKEDIHRHATHIQECHHHAQNIVKKGFWPCLYCGLHITAQNAQRLQQHIEQYHPQSKIPSYVTYKL